MKNAGRFRYVYKDIVLQVKAATDETRCIIGNKRKQCFLTKLFLLSLLHLLADKAIHIWYHGHLWAINIQLIFAKK